jgi:hypothetical protein
MRRRGHRERRLVVAGPGRCVLVMARPATTGNAPCATPSAASRTWARRPRGRHTTWTIPSSHTTAMDRTTTIEAYGSYATAAAAPGTARERKSERMIGSEQNDPLLAKIENRQARTGHPSASATSPAAGSRVRQGYPVVGFDVNAPTWAELRAGHDRTLETTRTNCARRALDVYGPHRRLEGGRTCSS